MFVIIFVLTSHLRYCEIVANLRFKLYWIRGNQDKTCFKTLTVLQIMSLQVGEGEVMTGTSLPLSILMPRYFTCPNTNNNIFSLDFQLREGSNTITSTMNPLPSHLSP